MAMSAVVLVLACDKMAIDELQAFIDRYQLPLVLDFAIISDDKPKTIKSALMARQDTIRQETISYVLLLQKDRLFLCYWDKQSLGKVSPDWASLANRIIKAGKNSENLLKACKINNTMTVIDGTAGFGHDSLILASTGASVIMIEQNPLIYALLQFEMNKMSQNPNWHKLLARLSLYFGQACDILPTLSQVDLIYLDPMFPKDSYKAKVAKPMQLLHTLVPPPSIDDEITLFHQAIKKCHKLIIKRPKFAPNFANMPPNQSIYNDVIRFDRYQGACDD